MKRSALVGFSIGLLLSGIYLLLGGQTFFLSVPSWAAIIFYPGFVIAWWCALFFQEHQISLSDHVYEIVGCVVVGITYAITFVAIHAAIRCLPHGARTRQ